MKDILGLVDGLKRPRLLIRTARLGAEDYKRETHLQRLLGYGRLPRTGDALFQLLEQETAVNEQRKSGDAGYSLTRHLDLLIAMVGEARILRASQQSRARAEQRSAGDVT